MKKANLNSLSVARSVSGATHSSTSHAVSSKHLARQKLRRSLQPVKHDAPEDRMEVDYLETSGSMSVEPPSPLTRIWANRASRREREDEDLVPEPGPPELSEDEDDTENDGTPDADEPEFLTDDEGPPVHVGISAREQLTAGFQLHAARAGVSLATIIFAKHISNFQFSTRAFGSR